jgi:hypothetical protein
MTNLLETIIASTILATSCLIMFNLGKRQRKKYLNDQ